MAKGKGAGGEQAGMMRPIHVAKTKRQNFSREAVRTGLEPATSCVTGRHSNQLNYRTNSE